MSQETTVILRRNKVKLSQDDLVDELSLLHQLQHLNEVLRHQHADFTMAERVAAHSLIHSLNLHL